MPSPRRVAYGSLLQERCRALHRRIIEVIEALNPNRLAEHVERLAHHALQGAVWDKAVTYCRQAGVKAAARSAYREAVAFYEQALVALQHLPSSRAITEQAIDIQLDMRTALNPLSAMGRALAYLYEAEAMAVTLDDPRRQGGAGSR